MMWNNCLTGIKVKPFQGRLKLKVLANSPELSNASISLKKKCCRDEIKIISFVVNFDILKYHYTGKVSDFEQ